MPTTVSWMALKLQKVFHMYLDDMTLSSHHFSNSYDANFSPVFSIVILFEENHGFLIADDIKSLQPCLQGPLSLFYMNIQERIQIQRSRYRPSLSMLFFCHKKIRKLRIRKSSKVSVVFEDSLNEFEVTALTK